MDQIAISMAGAAFLAVLTGWLGFAFGVRQELEKEQRARHLTGADELVAPLRALQGLARRFGREEVAKTEVASAFLQWSDAWDHEGFRLPNSWRHIAHSVRDATGTVFGGIAQTHIRPDCRELDLPEPDAMWQDFADDYLEHVASAILRWGDSSASGSDGPMTYDVWLVSTGRRTPFGSNRRGMSVVPG